VQATVAIPAVTQPEAESTHRLAQASAVVRDCADRQYCSETHKRRKVKHMPAKKVQVEIRQGEAFRTECRAGKHVVIIDQPAPGGTDAGPTPLDVQLMALGGCVAAIGRIIYSAHMNGPTCAQLNGPTF
jgi:hypothetical protein